MYFMKHTGISRRFFVLLLLFFLAPRFSEDDEMDDLPSSAHNLSKLCWSFSRQRYKIKIISKSGKFSIKAFYTWKRVTVACTLVQYKIWNVWCKVFMAIDNRFSRSYKYRPIQVSISPWAISSVFACLSLILFIFFDWNICSQISL